MSALGALLGFVLLLFLIVLVARAVLDWAGVLTPGAPSWVGRTREVTYRITEPAIGPVRRVVRPVRLGGAQIDLAFTIVFVATVVLRSLVSYL